MVGLQYFKELTRLVGEITVLREKDIEREISQITDIDLCSAGIVEVIDPAKCKSKENMCNIFYVSLLPHCQ